jgi:HPt (histidine-containing phosphotransfer) domain-containing protein
MERLMNNEGLAHEIIEVFLADIPIKLADLSNYIQMEDARRIEILSHAIAGAAANLGGESLRSVAREMEKAARNGKLGAVKELMTDLETQFGLLKEAMKQVSNT